MDQLLGSRLAIAAGYRYEWNIELLAMI